MSLHSIFIEAFIPSPEHSRFFLALKVLVGILLCAGSPFLALSFLGYFKDLESKEAWVESQATITESKLTKFMLHGRQVYSADVVYSFEASGRQYAANQIAHKAHEYQSEREAAKVVNKYPAGSQHPVHYDPANPQNCVVGKEASANYFLLLIPVFLFLAGALVIGANGLAFWQRMRGSQLPEQAAKKTVRNRADARYDGND